NPRGHVDALVGVSGQLLDPHLVAVRSLERKGGIAGCPIHRSVDNAETVRADAWRVVLVRPVDLSAVEVDRLDVGVDVLRVHDAVLDDGCARDRKSTRLNS